MKTNQSIRRREFLHLSGSLSAAALLQGLGAQSFAAEQRPIPGRDGPPGRPNQQELETLLAEMEAKGRQFLSVPRKDGQFLNLLLKAARAKNVLEVGTSHGYSTIWISLGLEETGGHLTTIEILPERVQLAKEHLARAALSHRVTFKQGDAHKVVPTLDGPFDFVFLDADKEGQTDYFNKLHPQKLPPGSLLLVHNAIHLRESMRDFLDMIGKHPDFDSLTLSLTMEDGFSVNYRQRSL